MRLRARQIANDSVGDAVSRSSCARCPISLTRRTLFFSLLVLIAVYFIVLFAYGESILPTWLLLRLGGWDSVIQQRGPWGVWYQWENARNPTVVYGTQLLILPQHNKHLFETDASYHVFDPHMSQRMKDPVLPLYTFKSSTAQVHLNLNDLDTHSKISFASFQHVVFLERDYPSNVYHTLLLEVEFLYQHAIVTKRLRRPFLLVFLGPEPKRKGKFDELFVHLGASPVYNLSSSHIFTFSSTATIWYKRSLIWRWPPSEPDTDFHPPDTHLDGFRRWLISVMTPHPPKSVLEPNHPQPLSKDILWIRRRNKRIIRNPEVVRALAREDGVKLKEVYFEDYTIPDQIALLLRYRLFFGVTGAGFTLATFLNTHIHPFILFPRCPHVDDQVTYAFPNLFTRLNITFFTYMDTTAPGYPREDISCNEYPSVYVDRSGLEPVWREWLSGVLPREKDTPTRRMASSHPAPTGLGRFV